MFLQILDLSIGRLLDREAIAEAIVEAIVQAIVEANVEAIVKASMILVLFLANATAGGVIMLFFWDLFCTGSGSLARF